MVAGHIEIRLKIQLFQVFFLSAHFLGLLMMYALIFS